MPEMDKLAPESAVTTIPYRDLIGCSLDNNQLFDTDFYDFNCSPHSRQIMRISVVVPFYNSQRYIEHCIQALLEQTYPSQLYEVIMVDNNSTDHSSAIVRKYPGIKLLSEAKQGAYAARNRGVAASKGEVIAFTDPDCVPSRDWLKQIDATFRHSGVRIIIGTQQFALNSLALRLLEDYEDEKNAYIFSSTIKRVYYGHANNMAVRKTLFSELGPFVEIPRGADVVFVRRCIDRKSCDAVCYSRVVKVRHLEIDSGRRYFEKLFIYGRSIRCYGHIANARPMTSRERLFVFRNTIKNKQYSWTRSTFLIGLLFVGLLYWIFGGISAALIPKPIVVPEHPQERL
jgi:glycosyltransferase involved in cell wall biosynthesis